MSVTNQGLFLRAPTQKLTFYLMSHWDLLSNTQLNVLTLARGLQIIIYFFFIYKQWKEIDQFLHLTNNFYSFHISNNVLFIILYYITTLVFSSSIGELAVTLLEKNMCSILTIESQWHCPLPPSPPTPNAISAYCNFFWLYTSYSLNLWGAKWLYYDCFAFYNL